MPHPDRPGRPAPEQMRELVTDYVHALHATYLDQAQSLSPGERGALPLLTGEPLTVVAAAAHQLHLIATTDHLPPPHGPEVAVADDDRGLAWTVRFYDPALMPELGLLGEDTPARVRAALGITASAYHLALSVGGGLTAHHAQHSGVALINQHTHLVRDLDRLRQALPRQREAVDELAACVHLGLDLAAGLLVRELSAGRLQPTGTAAEALAALLEHVTP